MDVRLKLRSRFSVTTEFCICISLVGLLLRPEKFGARPTLKIRAFRTCNSVCMYVPNVFSKGHIEGALTAYIHVSILVQYILLTIRMTTSIKAKL